RARREMSVPGRATVTRPPNGQKKISSGESEDLPELSAGSFKPEDSPDPTAASYRRGRTRSTRPSAGKSQRADIFVSRRLPAEGTSVRSPSLCSRVRDAFRPGGAPAATLPRA